MPESRKSVVITGASSGIGQSCVALMSQAGWQVFATVRKPADRDKLQAQSMSHVHPVMMDVEDSASIAAAAAQVESQLNGLGLDGLVNVAGIGMVRPVE